MQELPCDVARAGLPQRVEPLPRRGGQLIEAPAGDPVDGLLRLLGDASPPRVGALAEEEGQHPALPTEWGRVTVTWWTHKIRGLHRNDFIMAAKTGALVAESGHIRRDESREGRAP